MKISIFGLGYVGAVAAGCLAEGGHSVVGVDSNRTKVDMVNDGVAPIVEREIGEIIARHVSNGRLRATTDCREAVLETDISMICVGTPSQANGSLDLRYVRKVCEEIGSVLRDKGAFHIIVARSTMLPGTTRDVIIPILEQCSGLSVGQSFGVCYNPEFLREGTAVYDYWNPAKTVIGATDARSSDVLASLYGDLDANVIRSSIEVAEMVKYADNSWHALKVSFANEIGNICKALDIDSHDVMDIFCKDTKLNLSSYYLKPGFAFGGSCLHKDVRALNYKGRSLDLNLPVLNSIIESNQQQIALGYQMIESKGKRKVGVLGFSFKAGTDDLRESPIVELIERLLGKGFELKLYDRSVNSAKLLGANRDYIYHKIPHISILMADTIEEVMDHAEVLVVGNDSPEFRVAIAHRRSTQTVIDFVRISNSRSSGDYDGICW